MFDLLLRFISAADNNKARVRGLLRPEPRASLLPDFDLDLPWLHDVQVVRVGADELELGPPASPFRPGATRPGLPEDLTAWWDEVANWLKAPESEFALDIIEMLHELYLGRVPARVEQQEGLPFGLANATPKDNLLVALRSLLPDKDQEDEVPIALIAALSGLVFEASIDLSKWESASLSIENTGIAQLLLDRGKTETNVLRVEQRVDGFRLTLLNPQGQALVRDPIWHEIELRRGQGPSKNHPQIVRRIRVNHANDLDGVHVFDAMGATEHVGAQLWWHIEVIDVHGRVIHEGDAIDVRERLDPPPTPETVRVEWRVGEDEATLTIELPESTDPRDQLELAVYVKRSPLDACGYYGDADDIALLEGNRALDLDASEQLDPPPKLDEKSLEQPTADELDQWSDEWQAWLDRNDAWDPRWARLGLERVPNAHISVRDNNLLLKISKLRELADGHGLRFFVACERHVARGVLESLPTPAEHVLLLAQSERHMFALEAIPESAPARRFASVHGSEGPQLWGEARGPNVKLTWRHQDPRGDEPPVGGYRIWMRDPVAFGDPVPWRPVLEVQALPLVLATLRPLPGLGEARWTCATQIQGDRIPSQSVAADLNAAIEAAAKEQLQLLRQDHPEVDQEHVDKQAVDSQDSALELARREYDNAKAAGDDTPLERQRIAIAMAAWHSAMLGALDAQGRVRRVRLPLAKLTGRDEDIREILAKLQTPSVVWAYARDPEGHPYATVLALALPPRRPAGTPDFWEPLFGAAVLSLDELPGSRRTLIWNEQRRIELSWDGLDDRWHHDTQWAIEIRDRYAELREQLETPAAEIEIEIEIAQVLTVIVERSEPVVERVAVVPEIAAQDDWLAFRLLPPPAWQQAAHNVVNRTRLGHLHIDIERRASWPRASEYQRALAARMPEDGIGPWKDALQGIRKYAELYYEFPPSDRAREPSVHDESTLIFDRNTPYYYEVQLGARLMADSQAGDPSWASATRSPRRLGLPALPHWQIADNEGDPRAFRLTFELTTPLLASHLDEAELSHLAGAGAEAEAEASAASWLSSAEFPARFADCPIHLLPDLELELIVYLDLGTPELPALLPAFRWSGPLARGADAAGDAVDGLGFHLVTHTMAPFLAPPDRKPKVSHTGTVTTLEISTRPYNGLDEEIRQRLQDTWKNEQRNPFWARLRRGARWTSPFQLLRKGGERSNLRWGSKWKS